MQRVFVVEDGKLKTSEAAFIKYVTYAAVNGFSVDRVLAAGLVADIQDCEPVGIIGHEILEHVGLYLSGSLRGE